MPQSDRTFPSLLSQLHALDFDYAEGDGIDFEPYREFESAADTTSWLRAWTGNEGLTGTEYRFFGQDGTGGRAAFWIADERKALPEQPIVFFGSEGELAVVARDFSDYLWLLAGGVGPAEVALQFFADRAKTPHFLDFARRHATTRQKTPAEVVKAAGEAFPTFVDDIRALCG
jgi:hypothetical protein